MDKPRLMDQMRAAIRIRHYSTRTEAAFVHWISRYIFFHGKRHPRRFGRTGNHFIPDTPGHRQECRGLHPESSVGVLRIAYPGSSPVFSQ